jgi:hypothetical protein
MLSVKGIYDGGKISLLDKVNVKTPQNVIVTFLEDTDDGIQNKIYTIAEKNNALDFLKEPAEDIYTDNDLKIKYKK